MSESSPPGEPGPEAPSAPAPGLAPTGVSRGRLLVSGQQILSGRFRIEELLGVGGMGEVYLAEQVSLGRKVAVKVLTSDMSLVPGMPERFRREALLLSSVDHPAVVRIIDFGEWNGSACLVMELVRGESLESLARAGPLPPSRALPMLIQLAEGLGAIHAAGIIHRDLKLENVLVAMGAGGREQARLLDFGIARLAEPEGGTSGTQVGMVLGTPEYMSPEQALGHPLDVRSDWYSWGVMAHRLLAGTHPFPGPAARDFVLQHISAPPVGLDRAAPKLAPMTSLVRLVARCLEKEAAFRPGSAAEVVEALTECLAVWVPPEVGLPPIPLVAVAPPGPSVAVQGLTPQVASPPATITGAGRPSPRQLLEAARQLLGKARLVSVGAAGAGLKLARAAAETSLRSPRRAGLAIAALVLLAGLALGVRGALRNPTRVATNQLDSGDARGALATIRLARAGGSKNAADWVLEARALHQLKRHEEEWAAIAAVPEPELDATDERILLQLVEDFARDEKARELREQLDRFARVGLVALKAAAAGPSPETAWGAVRLLDARGEAADEVQAGYLVALEDKDCRRRATAARRLGEGGDDRATAALERLKATPRKRTFLFEDNCGQNEAAQALRQLNRRRAP